MLKLIEGKISPEYSLMLGQLQIKGAMPLAIKFKEVLAIMKTLLK
jgi:putative sterol carrier protein